MRKVKLIKLETLSDAPYPQEEKYPSFTTVKEGYIPEDYVPVLGDVYYIFSQHSFPIFHTSTIKAIVDVQPNVKVITTLNSRYRIEYE